MSKTSTKAFSFLMKAIVFLFSTLIISLAAQAEIPKDNMQRINQGIEEEIVQSMSEVYSTVCIRKLQQQAFLMFSIRKTDGLTFKFQIDTEFKNPAMNGVKTFGTIPLIAVNDTQLKEIVRLLAKRSLSWFRLIDSRINWNGVVSNGGILFKGSHSFTAVFDQIDQTSVAFVEVDVDEKNNLQLYLGYAG